MSTLLLKSPTGNIEFSNHSPLVLIAGMNVIESRDLAFEVAETLVAFSQKHQFGLVFKASFDKANRSSVHSFRGLGMEEGLAILEEVKNRFKLPLITDVHEVWQCKPVAQVVDVLQLPAFLARQTDLVEALAKTGKVINIKKPQYMDPLQMAFIVQKFKEFENEQMLLCERGTQFGYDRLIVDFVGMEQMKSLGAPVVFDVTHSLQCRSSENSASGGRKEHAIALAKAGVALGISALFVETHPDPNKAKCDGPSALPLKDFERLLSEVLPIDRIVKGNKP